MRRALVIVVACCGTALAMPAVAPGAGGPVSPVVGLPGVSVPGRPDSYAARQAGGGTLVLRMRGGRVLGQRSMAGRYGVPGVDYSGSKTGLSADGRTLVLAEIPRRYPLRRTNLVVLDARRLRIERRIALPGFFTVDAISPDGRRLYLIHYKDANGLNYEVRAYDIARGRLLREPIVDPREPDEKMVGTPVRRAVSHDGRWAYTLYQRPSDAPFIHALDTVRGTAACIDLDDLGSADPSTLRLVVPRGDKPLRVVSPAGTQALVDRRTFAVSRPPVAAQRPAKPPASRGRADGDGSSPPWAAAVGALAALAGLALLAARRRRYARSASFRNAS